MSVVTVTDTEAGSMKETTAPDGIKEQLSSPNISLRVCATTFGGVAVGLICIALALASVALNKLEDLAQSPSVASTPSLIYKTRGDIKGKTYNEAGQYWAEQTYPRGTCVEQDGDFYSLSASDLQNNSIGFDRYRNKVLLIINVAFFADETVAHYKGFEQLRTSFQSSGGSRGFEILAFPCSQFGRQVGPNASEIPSILTHVRPGNGFKSNVQHFYPIDVNGLTTHPVYQHLRTRCRNPRKHLVPDKHDLYWSPVSPSDICGNFEKFLVDANGKVRYRYPSQRWSVQDLEPEIRILMTE